MLNFCLHLAGHGMVTGTRRTTTSWCNLQPPTSKQSKNIKKDISIKTIWGTLKNEELLAFQNNPGQLHPWKIEWNKKQQFGSKNHSAFCAMIWNENNTMFVPNFTHILACFALLTCSSSLYGAKRMCQTKLIFCLKVVPDHRCLSAVIPQNLENRIHSEWNFPSLEKGWESGHWGKDNESSLNLSALNINLRQTLLGDKNKN